MADKEESLKPDFGKPLDPNLLLGFAEITNADKQRAVLWWDDHASEEWIGALDNPPIGKRKP